MSDSFPFKTEFQLGILKMMLVDAQFCEQCTCFLQEDYFDNLYLGWVFSVIAKFWKKFEKTPSVETLKNEASKFSADERLPYQTILDKVVTCEYEDKDYIRSELSRFVKSVVFIKEQRSVIDMYNSGSYDKAFDAVQRASEHIQSIDFDKDTCVDFDDFQAILDRIRKDTADKIKIGIPPIDAALNGGLPRGSLTVWVGTTNSGKSVVLTTHAVSCMLQGNKVLYIELEMSEEIVLARFIGCYTGINLNRLTRNEEFLTNEEKQKIREARDFFKKYLKIRIVKDEVRYVEDLSVFCKNIKAKFDYSALFIDYGMKLSSKERFKDRYEKLGEVYDRIQRIGMANDAIVVSAAQGNRAGRKKTRYSNKESDLLRLDDIADSNWINNNAGFVLTISKSERDEANNQIRFLLDKQRLGKTDIAVRYDTRFDCCRAFGFDLSYESFSPYEADKDDK